MIKRTVLLTTTIFILSIWGCKKTDTTAPNVNITSPANNTIVTETITIKAEASDNVKVNRVEFFLDGDLIATDSEEPFETEWNTTESSDGEHSLQCKAIDDSDNETKSSNVEVKVVNTLFTANFTNNFLCADCGEGILFISDMEGNVLGEATWTGNASFSIDIPEGLTDLSQKISVTTVFKDMYSDVRLNTNLSIDIGSTWTWKTIIPEPEDPNTVEINLLNIPDNDSYTVVTKGMTSIIFGEISSPLYVDIDYSPTDMYLRLSETDAVSKYIWENDLSSGSYEVDLSNLLETETKTIGLNGAPTSFGVLLWGYTKDVSRYEPHYFFDFTFGDNENISTADVNYPGTNVFEFQTYISTSDDGNDNSIWEQLVFGEIPDTYEKIDADFDFINNTPDNFKILTTSTNFNQILSGWEQDDNPFRSYWIVSGPSDLPGYQLPLFPDAVIEKYPNLNWDSQELSIVGLYDYPELNSYEEVLSIEFNSPDMIFDATNELQTLIKPVGTKHAGNLNTPDFKINNLLSNRGALRLNRPSNIIKQ
jgi:hypothetical protein